MNRRSVGCLMVAVIVVASMASCTRNRSAALPRTERVTINGPTVVAVLSVTPATYAGSPADLSTLTNDFRRHITSAVRQLQAHRIKIDIVYADQVVLVREGKEEMFTPPQREGVAYYIVKGRRPARQLIGLMTDSDLVAAALQYLNAER